MVRERVLEQGMVGQFLGDCVTWGSEEADAVLVWVPFKQLAAKRRGEGKRMIP